MITFLAFFIVLGILIFFHELGHFLMAKRIGIRVERFSLGFGPRLISKQWGETEYCISALPLGGYVKMTGEDPEEKLEGKPFEFGSRNVLERSKVVICGPLMNIILAILCIGCSFYLGRLVSAHLQEAPIIGWIQKESPAEISGMRVGDEIISINGKFIKNWQDLDIEITTQAKTKMSFLIKRDGETIEIEATPEEVGKMGIGTLGISHPMPAKVGGLTPGYPAIKAGLKIGDEIIKIAGESVSSWYEMSEIIHKNINIPLTFEINREGETLLIEITPQKDDVEDKGLIGINPYEDQVLTKYGFIKSLKKGFSETWHLTIITFQFIYRLFSGKASPKALGGPIMIYQVTGAAAKAGMSPLIYFMGYISLQLGILNLLPIPVLDGGHIFFYIIEVIKGSPVSIKHREISQQIGLAILILLMVFVFWIDIQRFIIPFFKP